MPSSFSVRFIYLFCAFGLFSITLRSQPLVFDLSSNTLSSEGSITINEWKGISGDDFSWMEGVTTNEAWVTLDTKIISDKNLPNWYGIGWFSTQIKVDERLVNKPIPFLFEDNVGAIEFYLDGELIDKLGSISSIEEDNMAEIDHHAEFLQIPDTLVHTLTVRFANYKSDDFEKLGLSNGFQLTFFQYDDYLLSEKEHEIEHTRLITVITFLASLGIIHLLLLIFYPAGQKNFYFTFIAVSVAVFTLVNNTGVLFSNPEYLIWAVYLKKLAWLFAYLCILKFSYSFTDQSSPRSLLVILIIALTITTLSIFTLWSVEIARSILSIIILFEYVRIVVLKKVQKEPVDLLLFGLSIFVLMIFLSKDVFMNSFDDGYPFLNDMIAITILIASISFYLLRDFAKAQIKLEYKYLEVKHLSERSVSQERKNKEKEFKQKLLEAENDRKSAELEEARALQLSMLPTKIPTSKYWDMAVSMETAYEVGGDYYDFYEASNDEFVAAVGDATGHGMKAGIIVATVKSNFLSTIGSHSLIETLNKISDGIRNLDLKMLYMGLMLFRIRKHQITFTSAGMPQAFWYKFSEQKVEEILIKAMPLGTKVNFPYQEVSIDAQKGDVLLIISDGLLELFNPKREQLGSAAIEKLLADQAGEDPKQILSSISSLKEKWSNGAAQEDDVTILVMKAI